MPEPELPDVASTWGIVVAGIGGTGIVTIGQVLGMAAHLEGKGVITQDATGMAQMGGATWSHVQIAADAEAIHAARVAMANADLVIACDAVVAGNKTTLAAIDAAAHLRGAQHLRDADRRLRRQPGLAVAQTDQAVATLASMSARPSSAASMRETLARGCWASRCTRT